MATATKTAAKAKTTKPGTAAKATSAKATPVKAAPAKPAPAAKKAVAAKPKAVAKPKAAPARKTTAPSIDPDRRRHYVEVAAYFIAERRGFMGGCEMEDWVMAETEIDRLLDEGKLNA